MPVNSVTKVFDNFTTGNSYSDSQLVDFLDYDKALVIIVNTGSNDAHYKVLGSAQCSRNNYDSDAVWREIQSESTLSAGSSAEVEVTKAYASLKVQVKSAVADSSTKIDCFIVKKANK